MIMIIIIITTIIILACRVKIRGRLLEGGAKLNH